MSTMRYVGARYVPIWYQNSVDQSADWEVNVEYEPLTFVTSVNNHLYLSKKAVPDNIGSPAQNTEYWLDMGIFTGQSTQQLQDEIDAINLEIDDIQDDIKLLKNRNFIFVSDSYGAREYNNSTLIELIAQRIGLPSTNYENIQINGSGFIGLGGGRPTFLEALQAHVFTIDADDITDIVVMGGANDLLESEADLLTAISQFCTYCHTTFKNADIKIAHTGRYWNKQYLEDIKAHSLPAWRKCGRFGASYITNSEYILHQRSLVESDGVHPTSDGVNEIAAQIASALNGAGCCDVHYVTYAELSTTTGAVYNTNSITNPQKIRISLDNDLVTVAFPEGVLINTYRSSVGAESQTVTISDALTIVQTDQVAMFGNYPDNVPKGIDTATVVRTTSSLVTQGNVPSSIYFGSDNKCYISIQLFALISTWSSLSIGGFQTIIRSRSMTIPSDCC